MAFDPYHQWLGIAAEEHPPNHYRLLGIELFESNPEVIGNGADRQMAFVRDAQVGQRQAESQRLLNEIATARTALLNPAHKARYDQELQASMAPPEPSMAPPKPSMAPPKPSMAVNFKEPPIIRRRRGPGSLIAVILLVVAVVGVSVVLIVANRGEKKPTSQAKRRKPLRTKKKSTAKPKKPEKAAKSIRKKSLGAKTSKKHAEKKKAKTNGAKESNNKRPNEPPSSKQTSEEPKPRPPKLERVPDEQTRAALERQVARAFRSELREAKTANQKGQLARTLGKVAKEEAADSAKRYVLLIMARDLAIQAADLKLANALIADVLSQYATDELDTRSDVLSRIVSFSRQPLFHAILFPQLEDLVTKAVQADRYSVAEVLCKSATVSAARSKNVELKRHALYMSRDVTRLATAYTSISQQIETLRKNPLNRQASTAAGKFFCFVKGDWKRGIPLLANGEDESLAELAKQELAPDPDLLKLADNWMAVASGRNGSSTKVTIQNHAVRFFRVSLSQKTGAERDHLKQQLRKLKQSYSLKTAFWKKGAKPARLLHTSEGFCFLSALGGAFNGYGEELRLVPQDDHFWHWNGKSAKFIHGTATELRLGRRGRLAARHREYMWKRGEGPIRMIHKSRGFCFLTSVGGQFAGGGEAVRVHIAADGYWYLSGNTKQPLLARAVSVQLVGHRTVEYEAKEHVWAKGYSAVKMIHSDEGFCFISGIGGAFDGGGEIIRTYIGPDGYWYLNGNAGRHIGGKAISIRLLGAWP